MSAARHLAVVEDTRSDEVRVNDEAVEAAVDLTRDAETYFHFPWPALDQVVGGMPPGDVCYVGAFSGHGKTTFLSSLTDAVFEQTETKLFYMGLESKPKTLRTHWACKRLGYDAGDLLTGAYLDWPNATDVRKAVEAELVSQTVGDKYRRVRFSGAAYVDAPRLWQEAKRADAFGAGIFVIDHVDHIAGRSGSLYEQSREVNQAILDIAHEFGFLMLVATQFNLDAVRGKRALLHLAPQPTYVKMGNHKREVAAWMLGLYKPLKLTGCDPEALKRYNAHGGDTSEILEPNTMAVSVMKHRYYGNREGQKAYLRVNHGRVCDIEARESGAIHGIRTARGVL